MEALVALVEQCSVLQFLPCTVPEMPSASSDPQEMMFRDFGGVPE